MSHCNMGWDINGYSFVACNDAPDYAWDKNIQNPVNFIYSWSSKFGTIMQSYGVAGTLQLIKGSP